MLKIVKRPPPAKSIHNAIGSRVFSDVSAFGKKTETELNAVYSNWRSVHRPRFKCTVVRSGGITFTVNLENALFKENGTGLTVEQLLTIVDETGAKPHVIEGNSILVFPAGNSIVFARKVNHPGFQPKRKLAPYFTGLESKLGNLIDKAYTKALKAEE